MFKGDPKQNSFMGSVSGNGIKSKKFKKQKSHKFFSQFTAYFFLFFFKEDIWKPQIHGHELCHNLLMTKSVSVMSSMCSVTDLCGRTVQ